MKETYEKVFIRSEADLPKEEGDYIGMEVINFRPSTIYFKPTPLYIKNWMVDYKVDWYLQPIAPMSRERVILDSLLAKIIKRRTDVNDVIDYYDVADFELAWIQKYIEESIASELCSDAGQREEKPEPIQGESAEEIQHGIPFKCPECGEEIQYGLSKEGQKLIANSRLFKSSPDKAIIERLETLIKHLINIEADDYPNDIVEYLKSRKCPVCKGIGEELAALRIDHK